MRVIFLSTPVGPLGAGIGGGVELTLRTLARELAKLRHDVVIVAPSGSNIDGVDGVELIEVHGVLHVPSQSLLRSQSPEVPTGSVLVNMWSAVCARAREGRADLVLNFAYDALPFVESNDCPVPIAHLVSMGSLSDEMDHAVRRAIEHDRRSVAMHSHAQAETFGPQVAGLVTIVGSGIDVASYEFVDHPSSDLAFVGRISPEKGIDDVFAVSAASGRMVRAFGVIEDRECWNAAVRNHPMARVRHEGFLPTAQLQRELGRCAGLIMVHKWVEAFGNVAIESLACGVPVVTYRRGGPAEIVRDGETGFVVPPDDVGAVVEAVARLSLIDRRRCRADVLERFSASAFALRVHDWLTALGWGV